MHKIIIFCMFFCVILQPKVLHARRGESYEPPSSLIKFDLKRWSSSGHGKFIISWPVFVEIPKSEIGTGSTLDYQNLDTIMNILSVEVKPFKRLSPATAELGYMGIFYSSRTGNYTVFFSDGLIYDESNLDRATISRKGFFIDLSARFF